MKALWILAREHTAIRAIAARFEAELVGARHSGLIDGEAVERMLEFFEREVDGHHQEKEERLFLPRLSSRTTGTPHRLVRALRLDHARERKQLAGLHAALEDALCGHGAALTALVRDGRRYLREQAEHARREETTLFPLALRLFSARDDLALLAAFRLLDREWGGTVWESSRALERWLDQRYQPVPA